MQKCHKRRKILTKVFKQKWQKAKPPYPVPFEGELHKTLKPDFPVTRNPYLNYFRQFYAKKKGRVVEAAIQAGANWRKMSAEQKAPYIIAAKNAPYVVTTRVKRLMRLANAKQGIFSVQKLLQKWTKHVYKMVIRRALKFG